jgi:signal transduction histidine kinase
MERLLQWRRLPYAVATAAVIMLAGLATLQYRWIGQIAQAERERMRSRLDASVASFQKRFAEAVSLPDMMSPDEPENRASSADRWLATMPDSRVVRELYEVSADGSLARYDRERKAYVPEPWPKRLDRLRARIADHGPGHPPFDEDVPAVAIPRLSPPPPLPEPADDHVVYQFRVPRDLRWTIVEYDREYLTGTVLPTLVRAEFGDHSPFDTAARIVSAADPARVIYATDPQLPASFFAPPDASAPIFDAGQAMMIRQPGRPPAGAQRGVRHFMVHAEANGPWVLQVKMRLGSLDAVIAHTRLHNLLLSGGVLLLIAMVTAVLIFATRRAQAYAQAQTELVAGVSHELRTPLAVICSAAENLSDGIISKDEAVRRYGSVIGREGRRLTGIVEQVLRFAGIQSGRTALDFEPVEVDQIITSALAGCDADIAASGIKVRTEIEPGLVPAFGDPVALTQCVRNLVDNAVRYGSQGGEVAIRAQQSGDSVEITVSDRGPGIEPSELGRIFEPFYRGRRALLDQTRGFGLGLALVKRLMDAHSGSVSVANLPGGGALFILRVRAAVKIPVATPAAVSGV